MSKIMDFNDFFNKRSVKKVNENIKEEAMVVTKSKLDVNKRPMESEVTSEYAADLVIDRLSNIYNNLSNNDKSQINKYFN